MVILWLVSLLLMAGYLALLVVLVIRPAPPVLRRVTAALFGVIVLLCALHAASWLPLPPFWRWLFDLNSEWALGAVFASGQLLLVALAAISLAAWGGDLRAWQRLYWLLIALVFIILALDEYFGIHEQIGSAADLPFLAGGSAALDAYLLLLGSAWRTLYVTLGGLVGAASVLAYWFSARHDRRLFALMVIGLALMALGGLGLDTLAWDVLYRQQESALLSQRLVLPEEFLEMGGVLLMLGGALGFAQRHLPERGWTRVQRAAAAGAGAWLAMALLNLGPLPALEARLRAEPVSAGYFGGAVALIGYELPTQIAAPGQDIDVTLYFRARRPPPEGPFMLTVQMLREPEMERIAEFSTPVDANSPVPMAAWVPGMVIRRTLRLHVPEDLAAPASYPLMVRLWSAEETAGAEVQISSTDRRLIGEDALILTDLAAPPQGEIGDPPAGAEYAFADGFSLYGWSLPEAARPGGDLPLTFWWRTEAPSGRHLVQFIHVFGPDGELAASLDEEPFGGAFPTSDWPAGIQMNDTRRVTLPEGLASGAYEVFTGLYEWPSLERVAVTDGSGAPVENAVIPLGTVELGR